MKIITSLLNKLKPNNPKVEEISLPEQHNDSSAIPADQGATANIMQNRESANPENADNNKTRKSFISERLTKEILHDLYFIQSKSLEDIAREYGCTRANIYVLMKKYGIQARKRSAARVLAIKNNKFIKFKHDDVNEDFFSVWSPGMAWVLGVIYTDGCLFETRTNRRTVIDNMDFELLDKVRTLIGSTRSILTRKQSYDNNRSIFHFSIHREKMLDDLIKIGLVPRKSLVMTFPEMPSECVRHFIRGCWDGDGSFYMTGGDLAANYISGSKLFVERLVEELYKVGVDRKTSQRELIQEVYATTNNDRNGRHLLTIHKRKGDKSNNYSYYVKFTGDNNVIAFYEFLYGGVDESIYLKRKHDIIRKQYDSISKIK